MFQWPIQLVAVAFALELFDTVMVSRGLIVSWVTSRFPAMVFCTAASKKFLAANPAPTQQVYCEETAQDVMRQMLQAINYLHSHNIVHRRMVVS